MATTSGAQHGLSLYLRICCVNSNLNWDRDLKQENKYILCPSSDYSLVHLRLVV